MDRPKGLLADPVMSQALMGYEGMPAPQAEGMPTYDPRILEWLKAKLGNPRDVQTPASALMSPEFWERMGSSPTVQSARSGFTLPEDVRAGRQPMGLPSETEDLTRVADLAGLAMTGGVAGTGRGGIALGSGPTRSAHLPMDEAARMARAKELGYTTEGYHATPYNFDEFVPSSWRGASYFAATPEGAMRGMGAGAAEHPALSGPTVGGAERGGASIIPALIRGKTWGKDPLPAEWFPENITYGEYKDIIAGKHPLKIKGLNEDELQSINNLRRSKMAETYDEAVPSSEFHKYEGKNEDKLPLRKSRDPTGETYGWEGLEGPSGEKARELNKKLGYPNWLVHDEGGSLPSIAVSDPANIRSKFAAFDPANEGSGMLLGSTSTDRKGAAALGGGLLGEREPIRAYHGSPHDYAAERLVRRPDGSTEYLVGLPDKLPDVPQGYEVLQDFPLGRARLDKIGTGEGAQAYGHGWYSAENEGVARGYRDALQSKAPAQIDGDPGSARYILQNGIKEARKFGTTEAERTTALKSWLDETEAMASGKYAPEGMLDNVREAKRLLASGEVKPDLGQAGRMYEVAIHADPDKFLDWDKPLSGQGEHVRQAVEGAASKRGVQLRGTTPDGKPWELDPGIAYDRLAQSNDARNRTGATDALREAGIPGIKYLDAGSRGAPAPAAGTLSMYETALKKNPNDPYLQQLVADAKAALAQAEAKGSHNYVLFDDKLVEILRKYGVSSVAALPPAVQMALQLSQQEPEKQ